MQSPSTSSSKADQVPTRPLHTFHYNVQLLSSLLENADLEERHSNLKDDVASRKPMRRKLFWNRGQKKIIRGRVPAYRLREDALRDYLGSIFPKQENFHIQVSWHQRRCQHAK